MRSSKQNDKTPHIQRQASHGEAGGGWRGTATQHHLADAAKSRPPRVFVCESFLNTLVSVFRDFHGLFCAYFKELNRYFFVGRLLRQPLAWNQPYLILCVLQINPSSGEPFSY
jgi:hypothetical protein